MESPVANKVTSQPRATSPSAMLPATVSQAPYCRGGVRQATGDNTAIFLLGMVMLVLLHGSQNLIEWNGRETGGVIGQSIRDDQFAVVQESATCINDVRHVALPFVFIGLQQRFAEAADDLAGIIAIQQERADAILSQGADTVAEHQPSCVGLNGGSA